MELKLIKGKQYLYKNTVKVGRTCKKREKQEIVMYVGVEENKEIFEKETGSELLIHTDDVEKYISYI